MRAIVSAGVALALCLQCSGCRSAQFEGVLLGLRGGITVGETKALVVVRPDGSTEVVYEDKNGADRSNLAGGLYDWRRGKYYIASGEREGLIAYDPRSGEKELIHAAPGPPGSRGWFSGMDISPDCAYVLFGIAGEGLFRWEPDTGEPVQLGTTAPRYGDLRIVGPRTAYLIDWDTLYSLDPETGATQQLYCAPGRLCDVDRRGRWVLEAEAGGGPTLCGIPAGSVPEGETVMVDSAGQWFALRQAPGGRRYYLREITPAGVGEATEVKGLGETVDVEDRLTAARMVPKFAGDGVLVYTRERGWYWDLVMRGLFAFDIGTGREHRLSGYDISPVWHGPGAPP